MADSVNIAEMSPYTDNFFRRREQKVRQSAEIIVPLVIDMVRPQSVIDIGCGTGTFLSIFRDCGIKDYLGVDGDYVDEKMLQIPREHFIRFDLKKPLHRERSFDLVVSLEVAEHLPEECAQRFVKSLVALGPVILFSAAIPLQGGVHHLNEQWPEYWVEHFARHDYLVVDCLRRKIWQEQAVSHWYAQNCLIFVHKDRLADYPELDVEYKQRNTSPLSVVHPRQYLAIQDEKRQLLSDLQHWQDARNFSLKKLLKALPGAFCNALRWRINHSSRKS